MVQVCQSLILVPLLWLITLSIFIHKMFCTIQMFLLIFYPWINLLVIMIVFFPMNFLWRTSRPRELFSMARVTMAFILFIFIVSSKINRTIACLYWCYGWYLSLASMPRTFNISHFKAIDVSRMSASQCVSSKQCLFVGRIWTSPHYYVKVSKYYLFFVNDYSKYSWFFPMQYKHKAFDYFLKFKVYVENTCSTTPQVLDTNDGDKYLSTKFQQCLSQHGIFHRMSCPHTPWIKRSH